MDRMRPRLAPVALVPEVRLHLFPPSIGLWEAVGGEYRSEQPPPFWAFAWPGGQALARHVLDHPDLVTGRPVLDIACGSGLVGIAAALAGGSPVHAMDVDAAAVAATHRNARANGVAVAGTVGDVASPGPVDAEVVVAGDVFYSEASAGAMASFLHRAGRRGARVLVGDAGRGFLPRHRLRRLAEYDVPVSSIVEGVPVRRATVWEFARPTTGLGAVRRIA
jgi:predicted nicotinamide N-methyase